MLCVICVVFIYMCEYDVCMYKFMCSWLGVYTYLEVSDFFLSFSSRCFETVFHWIWMSVTGLRSLSSEFCTHLPSTRGTGRYIWIQVFTLVQQVLTNWNQQPNKWEVLSQNQNRTQNKENTSSMQINFVHYTQIKMHIVQISL